ncbi:MAG: hypothetical protein H7210_06115 [Pyrinomonadaceae bacterium]|nr:hypothetical protein [Phycisphaerales bacterium]
MLLSAACVAGYHSVVLRARERTFAELCTAYTNRNGPGVDAAARRYAASWILLNDKREAVVRRLSEDVKRWGLDTKYEQLIASEPDPDAALSAAQEFMTDPLSRDDPRREDVRRRGRIALARWFSMEPQPSEPSVVARAEAAGAWANP